MERGFGTAGAKRLSGRRCGRHHRFDRRPGFTPANSTPACRVVNSRSAAGPVGRGDAPLAWGHSCDVTQVRAAPPWVLDIRAQSAAARNGSSFATGGIPLARPPWSAHLEIYQKRADWSRPRRYGCPRPERAFWETFGF
jgi:hypothetical protein